MASPPLTGAIGGSPAYCDAPPIAASASAPVHPNAPPPTPPPRARERGRLVPPSVQVLVNKGLR